MLTSLSIHNFKRLKSAMIELGQSVVFIGPNNSGKTTALQAIALWSIGVKRLSEKRADKNSPDISKGVTINRRDLISIPVPDANLLWNSLHIQNQDGNVSIDIVVEGITQGRQWKYGLEFDYANEESFYCRPLRVAGDSQIFMDFPKATADVRIAFLPPMSGLAAIEPKWEPGRVNVLLGEGQTAQVLRNLCYQIHDHPNHENWYELKSRIHSLFGVELQPPEYIIERGEIAMMYKDEAGNLLDISSSGRGLQQTLLLLAHLYANPSTVLLMDEPDAHLEILRQRQIYQLLTDLAKKQNSQLIAASHSEIVLNEAADRDVVVAFVGTPHRINDRGSQLLKSLREIGFDQYYQAEQTGWVLYLEGSTDLAILKMFAEKLNHPAMEVLEKPFVHYVGNQPNKANEHFWGLREAKRDLKGIGIFDRLERGLPENMGFQALEWKRRELENYLCMREVLMAYARYDLEDDLFGLSEREIREKVMVESIFEIESALESLNKPSPWSNDIKASDDFLDPLFKKYFQKLNLPNALSKTNYHILAGLVPVDKIDLEIMDKLDAINTIYRHFNLCK